jgi:hypothetical protein
MDVGAMMVFASSGWENCPDGRVWDEGGSLASPPITCPVTVTERGTRPFSANTVSR